MNLETEKLFQSLPNIYEFLGLPKNCDSSQIRKSYRSLTMVYHPDRSDLPDAAMKFDILKKATDILSDKELRK